MGRTSRPTKKPDWGGWTDAEIVKALRNGVRPDGRQLAPIMPSQAFAALTDADAAARAYMFG